MAEVMSGGAVRERITFTGPAWARIKRLAARLGLDERDTLKMLVALQLAQLEASLGAADSGRVRAAVEADMTDNAESFLQSEPDPVAPIRRRGRPVGGSSDEPMQAAPLVRSGYALSAPGRSSGQDDGSYMKGL
jgi:hypothetical protein